MINENKTFWNLCSSFTKWVELCSQSKLEDNGILYKLESLVENVYYT